MDPNAVVLEISSDDETGWDGHEDKGITYGGDDYNWIADILDEVNRDDCGYDDGGDDSDEVVLVSEVLPKKPRNKSTSKSSSLIDLDDDCVVLDHDPDKPLEVRNDNPVDRDEDDDSDDVLVVSEKGQVACRDYPHPRHLCIKFPFSSTPNQSYCDQCYCYVCDSLAPCIYWGNGSGDHCLASDKDDFWVLERQNSKNVSKGFSIPPMNPVPQTPTMAHNQVSRPNPIQACPVTPNFGVPNTINQIRAPFLLSRNKYQPGLVSQQLTRTSSCTIPRDRVHNNYNLAAPFHRTLFKRTVSDVVAPTTNRYSYSSHFRDNCRNQFTGTSQPNVVNSSVPINPLPRSNTLFDFPPNCQPLVNSSSYIETPGFYQPNPVSLPSQSQVQSSLPDYSIPSAASQQESQRTTVDPKVFHGISWPQSQANHQPAAQSSLLEALGPTNEPTVATGSSGLVDYEYDNWMFNNQPCEPGSMDVSGPFGLNKFSPEPAYMDAGTIFEF